MRALSCGAAILAAFSLCPPVCADSLLMRCGVLEDRGIPGENCLVFVHPGLETLLDDYGGFGAGDTVLVFGTYHDWPYAPFCGGYRPWIEVEEIEEGCGFDFGCGTLFDEGPGECSGFSSRRYGVFRLSSWGGFVAGDTVRVYGDWVDVLTWCSVDGGILVDSIRICVDTLTVVSPTTWGRLKALYR